jgi:dynein assembly factor with WDR repeat domains 1
MFALESKKNQNVNILIMYISSKIHTLIGHTAEVSSAQFNWDCSRIVTGSMDKTCKLWDTLSGKR